MALYALGSESESRPGYVVMPDPGRGGGGGVARSRPATAGPYANAFLPSIPAQCLFRPGMKPVLNRIFPAGVFRGTAPENARS